MASRAPGRWNGRTMHFSTCLRRYKKSNSAAMPKRFVSIWFRYLLTDREAIRQKSLTDLPVAFTEPDHGRMLVPAMNEQAEQFGITKGITAADARVIAPGIQLFETKPGRNVKLLKGLAEWCLRYTPLV